MKRSAYPGTQAVLRAVRLLKAFTAERPERGLLELSRHAALNKTTTYRLLTALESEGLIERLPDREGFRLGAEVLALGSRALGADRLRAAARAELLALAQVTRETATLEVLAGRDVLILDEVMGGHMVGSTPSVGTRWPAHTTSTGKAMLAHLPAQAVEAFLAEPLQGLTARTIRTALAFRRELERVRLQGYSMSLEELEPQFVAVGAPVWGGTAVVAALSVGGPRPRFSPNRVDAIARQVVAAAGRVSQQLGHAQPGAAASRRVKR